MSALPGAQALQEVILWNHSWVGHLPRVTNLHENAVPGRLLILLEKGDAFPLWTTENYINICVSLFAPAARRLGDKFTAKLLFLWFFRLHVLSVFLFLLHWPPNGPFSGLESQLMIKSIT